jgi:predicted alpha-1,2-mannosidase
MKVLEERLDSLFTTSSELVGEDVSPDISGLIGQYAHGNEPSHHIIYFYTMIGKPNKAADRVRQVLKEFYSTEADGLSGNEDAGQMSAWFIMSSLGFYQVEPAGARYWFGSPSFDEATIQVPGGKFTVKAENNSAENNHIISATLNGKKLNRNYITHTELMNGGTLTFKMGK